MEWNDNIYFTHHFLGIAFMGNCGKFGWNFKSMKSFDGDGDAWYFSFNFFFRKRKNLIYQASPSIIFPQIPRKFKWKTWKSQTEKSEGKSCYNVVLFPKYKKNVYKNVSIFLLFFGVWKEMKNNINNIPINNRNNNV